jgi:hypothetical protein
MLAVIAGMSIAGAAVATETADGVTGDDLDIGMPDRTGHGQRRTNQPISTARTAATMTRVQIANMRASQGPASRRRAHRANPRRRTSAT